MDFMNIVTFRLETILYHRVDTIGVTVIFVEIVAASEDVFDTA